MNRSRNIFLTIIIVALLIIGASFISRLFDDIQKQASVDEQEVRVPKDAILVDIQSSNTKQDWMDQVAANFNEGNVEVNGKPIVVTVSHVGSGSSMDRILDGESQPVVWSPGSDLWVTRMNQLWQDRNGRHLISQACPATLRLPLIIAMWQPMAEALGWPNNTIGWDDIARLANDPEGWDSYGHPEWGSFKFGHPHPAHSNSGMLSIVAEVYSSVGATSDLTVDMVKSDEASASLSAIEQQVFHYGKKDTDILGRMTQHGPSYLHAVTSYESNVIKWNLEHASELHFPLVSIYPDDGTFWVENPYCILDNSDWVSDEQAEAAALFKDYLLSNEQQALAVDWGLRPADPDVSLHEPIVLKNGAVPALTSESVPHLSYPSDEIVGHILEMWQQVKKKATVIMLLDTSGSMSGDKIKNAVEGALVFIDQMDAADEIYLITFATDSVQLSSGSVGAVGESVRGGLEGVYADGATALYQAIADGLALGEQLQEQDMAEGESCIYGIVLLSDGKNESDLPITWNQVLSQLPSGEKASDLKIYSVAYGDDADSNILTTLANRTNGKFFTGDVSNISDIYFLISSEF
ncbi:MAG: VWA domain-containing protein [Chloroflexi bacterium]|nr:VWA domain-containing protein [Chloroflexota bacterium]